jgi:16S rRNA U516 pseudouridylate synthase RsuA-like enzyme
VTLLDLLLNDPHVSVNVITQEGKNRQIRKMVGAYSHEVVLLRRVCFGGVTLEGLAEGEADLLSDDEVKALLELTMNEGEKEIAPIGSKEYI